MEATPKGISPHYGWGSFKKFQDTESFNIHKIVGTYSAMEGKGFSGAGGNMQDTVNPKRYIKMNSVLAAMEFVIFTVKNRCGAIGSWHALSGLTKDNYEKRIKQFKHTYTTKISNGEI